MIIENIFSKLIRRYPTKNSNISLSLPTHQFLWAVLLETPHLEVRAKCIALNPLASDKHMTLSILFLYLHTIFYLSLMKVEDRVLGYGLSSRTDLPPLDIFHFGVLTIPGYHVSNLTSCNTNTDSFAQNIW